MDVIVLDDAGAVTIDGEHWELYIQDCFAIPKPQADEFAAIKLPNIRYKQSSVR